MHRAKWLLFDGGGGHKALLTALRQNPFDPDSGRGFEITFRDARRLRCKFVERVVSTEEVTDPFGNTTHFEAVRYSTTLFQLHLLEDASYAYLLEVLLPPRSLRQLITALDNILEGVTVQEVELALFRMYAVLRSGSPTARITRIKASRLKLTADSEARVELLSVRDAYKDFGKAFGDPGAQLDKVKIERPFGVSSQVLEVSRNGLVAHDESLDDQVRSFVLQYLAGEYANSAR
jgi:hypothetical protein